MIPRGRLLPMLFRRRVGVVVAAVAGLTDPAQRVTLTGISNLRLDLYGFENKRIDLKCSSERRIDLKG